MATSRRAVREPDCACSHKPLRPPSLLISKSSHSGGMLTKSVSAPPRTTRTKSRSWRPERCSMSTARASAGSPPAAYRSEYSRSVEATIWRSRSAKDEASSV